jgi:hypothetical protein
MPLKNYTSTVPAIRSIAYIETKLAAHGARKTMKEFSVDGRVIAVAFIMEIQGNEVPFKLPARVEACERVLQNSLSSRTRPETRKKIPAQAERTAWKILSDWIEAQMAMIELAQVEMMEVFLPYVYDAAKDQTYFQALKKANFKALLPGPK